MGQRIMRAVPGLLLLVLAYVVLLLALTWIPGPLALGPGAVSAQSTACYREQGGAKWVCASGGEMEFRSGATLDIQTGATLTVDDVSTTDDLVAGDDVTATDDVIANGDSVTGAYVVLPRQSQITVTAGGIITPTGTFVQLTAAGAVTAGVFAPGAEGRVLIVENATTNAITIPDSTTNMLSGAIVLGQYDTLTLISDGTNWIQVATSNN
jgi:hypothetical protein